MLLLYKTKSTRMTVSRNSFAEQFRACRKAQNLLSFGKTGEDMAKISRGPARRDSYLNERGSDHVFRQIIEDNIVILLRVCQGQ
jgi:hypothetical protein